MVLWDEVVLMKDFKLNPKPSSKLIHVVVFWWDRLWFWTISKAGRFPDFYVTLWRGYHHHHHIQSQASQGSHEGEFNGLLPQIGALYSLLSLLVVALRQRNIISVKSELHLFLFNYPWQLAIVIFAIRGSSPQPWYHVPWRPDETAPSVLPCSDNTIRILWCLLGAVMVPRSCPWHGNLWWFPYPAPRKYQCHQWYYKSCKYLC